MTKTTIAIIALVTISPLLLMSAILFSGHDITFNQEAVDKLNKTTNALVSTCKYTSKGNGDFTIMFGPVEVKTENGTTTLEDGIVTCDRTGQIIDATSTER